jgi:hypothetical protein
MMTYKQIQDQLELATDPKEISFLEDQLWEIRAIAEDVQSSALEAMNGGNQHV